MLIIHTMLLNFIVMQIIFFEVGLLFACLGVILAK